MHTHCRHSYRDSGQRAVSTVLSFLSWTLSVSIVFSLQADANGKRYSRAELKEIMNSNMSFPEMRAGLNTVKSALRKAKSMDSYSFKVRTWTFKPQTIRMDGGNFSYLKPDMIKVEVTEGKRKGSALVKRKDGRIRGHLGGAMKLFNVSLDPGSKRLKATNGYNLISSDYASLFERIVAKASKGASIAVTSSPVDVKLLNGWNASETKKALVIDVYESKSKKELISRFYLDPDSQLPLQWSDYDHGSPEFITRWLKTDRSADLGPSDFEL